MHKIFPWFYRMDLQGRLFTIFSVLFLCAALILGNFLWMSGKVIGYNSAARQTYESARQTYRLQDLLVKMELAHNVFLADEGPGAQGDFTAYGLQLRDEIASIKAETQANAVEGDAAPILAALDDLEAQRQQYTGQLERIAAAAEAGDYDTVNQVDPETNTTLDSMYIHINTLNAQRNDELSGIQEAVDWFSTTGYLSILIVLPVYLAIVAIAVLIIHFQINVPLDRLLQATRSLEAGKFQPEPLGDLTLRQDEIGLLANEFGGMASAVLNREGDLQAEAARIRAKIR